MTMVKATANQMSSTGIAEIMSEARAWERGEALPLVSGAPRLVHRFWRACRSKYAGAGKPAEARIKSERNQLFAERSSSKRSLTLLRRPNFEQAAKSGHGRRAG